MMWDPLSECLTLREQIAGDRNYLHEHPELSGREEHTLGFIAARLDELGIPHRDVKNGGLVAELTGRGPGKRLLFRADTDALPVAESRRNLSADKRAVSGNEGVSHACGHDAHTAMLLGALRVLADHRADWDGALVAVFERGEETSSGVLPLMDDLLARYGGFDGCFSIHVYADAPEGTISVQPGYVMSGALSYEVELRGMGGHSSRPDYCRNPIDCFVSIYNNLASARMRRIAPDQCLTHAVGVVQAGSQSNIIPGALRFAGTARFFDEAACGAPFLEELKRCVEYGAALHGCEVTYRRIFGPAPGVYNDEACAALAKDCLREALGGGAVMEAPPWMASESMAVYLTLFRGVLAFLGIQNGTGCGAPHHSPEFDLDPDRLYLGSAAFAAYARAFFSGSFSAPERKDAPALLETLKRRLC